MATDCYILEEVGVGDGLGGRDSAIERAYVMGQWRRIL
mgnify:CR=1 FL=1